MTDLPDALGLKHTTATVPLVVYCGRPRIRSRDETARAFDLIDGPS